MSEPLQCATDRPDDACCRAKSPWLQGRSVWGSKTRPVASGAYAAWWYSLMRPPRIE